MYVFDTDTAGDGLEDKARVITGLWEGWVPGEADALNEGVKFNKLEALGEFVNPRDGVMLLITVAVGVSVGVGEGVKVKVGVTEEVTLSVAELEGITVVVLGVTEGAILLV